MNKKYKNRKQAVIAAIAIIMAVMMVLSIISPFLMNIWYVLSVFLVKIYEEIYN